MSQNPYRFDPRNILIKSLAAQLLNAFKENRGSDVKSLFDHRADLLLLEWNDPEFRYSKDDELFLDAFDEMISSISGQVAEMLHFGIIESDKAVFWANMLLARVRMYREMDKSSSSDFKSLA